MRILAPIGLALLMMIAPLAASQDDCPQPDPGTLNVIDLTAIGGGYTVCEERDAAVPTNPPVPLSGFLSGNGTWCYEETNGYPGIQRGGVGILGDWFPPGCNQSGAGVLWQDDQTPYLIDASKPNPMDWTIDPTWANHWHVDPAGPVGVPCLIIGEDPINDETCGAGPDTLVLGMQMADVLPKNGYSIIKTAPLVNTAG